MTIRKIIQPDNPILRKKAVRVASFDSKFQTLVDDMVETMIDAPGVGLAAPQVAVSQRLIVVKMGDDEETREEYGEQAGKLYVVANPEIIKHSRRLVEGVEACLSIPGYVGKVERWDEVIVTGQDRHGKAIRIKAKEWLARIFQHEIDHLNGQLYIDIASEVWKPEPEDQVEGESPAEASVGTSSAAPDSAPTADA
ncbi:MAG: peptide deformylase [Chloroflexi bacterium]|nr:peptide deformylase [Chloroflexota bacterium]